MRVVEEVEFVFEPRVEQEGDLWSAYCDELELASSGTTEEEARHNLLRTLENTLTDLNYHKRIASLITSRFEHVWRDYHAIMPLTRLTASIQTLTDVALGADLEDAIVISNVRIKIDQLFLRNDLLSWMPPQWKFRQLRPSKPLDSCADPIC